LDLTQLNYLKYLPVARCRQQVSAGRHGIGWIATAGVATGKMPP
jgi:hypothetical protein